MLDVSKFIFMLSIILTCEYTEYLMLRYDLEVGIGQRFIINICHFVYYHDERDHSVSSEWPSLYFCDKRNVLLIKTVFK